MQPPVRRVLALDAGSRQVKMVLAESFFGRFRLLKEEMFDLQAEGLVAADELKVHLQATLSALGNPALAVVLPQQTTISQVLDLPTGSESDIRKLIEDETVKLSGVSESRIIYDFVRTGETPARNRQHFRVTQGREEDIRNHLVRLGVEDEDVCEITTCADALVSAYSVVAPAASRAVLVHLGAQTTIVAVVLNGEAVAVSSFPMGSDFFTRSLARLSGGAVEAAESKKRGSNLFDGPDADPDFRGIVDGWIGELKTQLEEWFRGHGEIGGGLGEFQIVASGGGFDEPGLLDYLEERTGWTVRSWPRQSGSPVPAPGKGFEVAAGVAFQALGYAPRRVSLLLDNYRRNWRKRVDRQRLEFVSMGLLALCVLALMLGTWHKLSLIGRKGALMERVHSGQETADANEALTAELVTEYEQLRPILAGQQNTADTLKTLALLERTRSNKAYWYVLVADEQSYFSYVPPPVGTNNSPTNPPPPIIAGFRPLAPEKRSEGFAGPGLGHTNYAGVRPGMIVELSMAEGTEMSRVALSEFVSQIKEQKLFARVDLVSEDLRRPLAIPAVVVPDRHFALALDFSVTELQQPAPPRRAPAVPVDRGGRRPAKSGSNSNGSNGESNTK
jgi:Tfp pilus assembly PilM family ATPase